MGRRCSAGQRGFSSHPYKGGLVGVEHAACLRYRDGAEDSAQAAPASRAVLTASETSLGAQGGSMRPCRPGIHEGASQLPERSPRTQSGQGTAPLPHRCGRNLRLRAAGRPGLGVSCKVVQTLRWGDGGRGGQDSSRPLLHLKEGLVCNCCCF